MICPKCKGDNVTVAFVESGGRTSSRGSGFGGHMNNTARAMTAFSTLGISNLVWKSPKELIKPRPRMPKRLYSRIAVTTGRFARKQQRPPRGPFLILIYSSEEFAFFLRRYLKNRAHRTSITPRLTSSQQLLRKSSVFCAPADTQTMPKPIRTPGVAVAITHRSVLTGPQRALGAILRASQTFQG